MKEYFIVSDLHSQYHLLIDALNKADFSIDNDNHILVIAGDVLDRGSEGDQLIRYLEKLIKRNRLLGVVGNHDSFLIDLVKREYTIEKVIWNFYRNGFNKTLELVYKDELTESLLRKPFLNELSDRFIRKYPVFINWLKQLPNYLEYDNHVIVHGFLDFTLEDWHESSKHTCIWDRGYNKNVPESFKKTLIIGHTPNYNINLQDDIIFSGQKIMIDGGAAMRHQVNVLKLNENER